VRDDTGWMHSLAPLGDSARDVCAGPILRGSCYTTGTGHWGGGNTCREAGATPEASLS
jgi:hypothetical protein